MLIPNDVRDYIRSVFRACNARTANALMSMPNTHEEILDTAFVAQAAEFSAPIRFPSEWIVRIDTHFLGGRRHFLNWEIADIGVLIVFRRGGKIVRSKVALLQSKRLYASEQEYDENERADYEIGFARLFRGNARFESITAPRLFSFGENSKYKALKVGDNQYRIVQEYEDQYGIPVYYMLYHPGRVPFETEIPRIGVAPVMQIPEVGARILPGQDLRNALAQKPEGYSPMYYDLKNIRPQPELPMATSPGWRVEEFIADLAIECKVGYLAEKESDEGLSRIFNRRAGPIAAAIAVTFDAPPGWQGGS